LKILDVSSKQSLASLAWPNSAATLGLEMSEEPTNVKVSIFSCSAAMTANDSREHRGTRLRAGTTANHERLFGGNKRPNNQKTVNHERLSRWTTQNWIRFALNRISNLFVMFSIRWALFCIFLFCPRPGPCIHGAFAVVVQRRSL
jgi:hypothetical protein